jgi:glycosyltransferase involved in cell wall biosynthesis
MSAGEGPPVSVVTPFYNTAAYLAECIESVLAQSYRNFEYVLVDNQSTDGSGDVAAAYAARDSRIRLYRTERFLTQIQNYNFTLSRMASASRYCKIVQADDWIFEQCLAEMVDAAERHPSVAVVSSHLLQETRVWGGGLPASAKPHLLTPIFLFGSPTSVMYRADVVRERIPFFEEGRYHPDTEVIYDILREHDFVFVHQILTFMRQQEGSISWRAQNLNTDQLDLMITLKRFGPFFLNPSEYTATLKGASDWYYRGLAAEWVRSGFRQSNTDFWERQRNGLAGVGEQVRYGTLVRAALRLGFMPLSKARALLRG